MRHPNNIIETPHKEPIKIIKEHQTIKLSSKDQWLISESLDSYTLNSSMKEALDMHHKFIK